MNCLFAPCKSTRNSTKWRNLGHAGLQTIVKRSKEKGDGLHLDIALKLSTQPPQQLRCHASCGASYTSKDHKGRETTKKRRNDTAENEPPMRRRRSQLSGFDFKCHCLLCGEECLPMAQWMSVIQTDGTKSASARLMFDQAD